jgi:hypothetical protein
VKSNVENEKFFLNLVAVGIVLIRPDGTVFNPKTEKVYTNKTSHGYIQIGWRDGRKVRHILAHRLVFLVLVGPLEAEEQVNHKDGVKTNNLSTNLEKVSNQENTVHAYKTGLIDKNNVRNSLLKRFQQKFGTSAKLSPEQVLEIRTIHASEKITHKELAIRYGISRSNISRLLSGKNYSKAKQILGTKGMPDSGDAKTRLVSKAKP